MFGEEVPSNVFCLLWVITSFRDNLHKKGSLVERAKDCVKEREGGEIAGGGECIITVVGVSVSCN